ncbi:MULTISPECIES: hypothetical protein [Nostoc]|nr:MULTISPECIES: hypothetical protein [Nostoc]
MNYSILQKVSFTALKTEARQMMAMCFWSHSHYWSSCLSSTNKNSLGVVIRVACFKKVNWVGFNFCKYHAQAVEVFRNLPESDRFFYEIKPNCYASFKVWCIDSQHFDLVVSLLKNYADIELEFAIADPNQVPEIFKVLKLQFFQRNVQKC